MANDKDRNTLQPGSALSELAVPILKFLWEEKTGLGILLLSTNAKHTFQRSKDWCSF